MSGRVTDSLRIESASGAGRTIVYLVSEDWYFLSHRLPMALAARDAGYLVHVATRVTSGGAEIERHGFALHPVNWQRGSTNPVDTAAVIREVRALYRTLKPDIAHHVALQPSIVGSLAALGLPMARLNALTGLGFAFTSGGAKARMLRLVLSTLLSVLLRRPGAAALVQNPDDREALLSIGVLASRIELIPGSGVDTDDLTPLPDPAGPVTAAFVGRLLADKGIRSLIAAHKRVIGRGIQLRLLVAGSDDPANPASIPPAEIESWKTLPDVEILGHVKDIRSLWARAHIAVLPSRREGLPKSLLEAAAVGRPIVATDVPGCREIARQNVNALLVPVDDPEALAEALGALAQDAPLRHRLGAAGRRLVEDEFSSERIGRQIVALYDRLLSDSRDLPAATVSSERTSR